MAEDQYSNPEDSDLLERYYSIVNAIQKSPINPKSSSSVQYEYANNIQREYPSQKMDEGFDKLGRIFKESLTEVKETIVNTNQVIHRDAERTSNYMLSQASVIAGKTSTFMNETFSRDFNKPALWSRDIAALVGNANYRDMSPEQAKYYAGVHMKQRGEMGLVQAAGLAAWIGPGGGVIPGFAYSMLAQPILEKYVVQRHEYQNYLDKTGMKNILAGQSQNTLMHTGWTDEQKKDLTKYLMGRPYSETGFDREEADQIREFADQLGYYKGTASVENYKQKTKALFTNVREIMKALHTSVEDAVEVMAGVSMMAGPAGGKPYKEAVGQLIAAVHYTGLPPTQLMGVANQVGESLYNAYGVKKEWGSRWGLELQKRKETALIKQTGLEYFMKNPIYMAAFSTWDEEAGKFNINEEEFLKLGQMDIKEILEKGRENLKGKDSEDSRTRAISLKANLFELATSAETLTTALSTQQAPLQIMRNIVSRMPQYTKLNADPLLEGYKASDKAEADNIKRIVLRNVLRTRFAIPKDQMGTTMIELMKIDKDPLSGRNLQLDMDVGRKRLPVKSWKEDIFKAWDWLVDFPALPTFQEIMEIELEPLPGTGQTSIPLGDLFSRYVTDEKTGKIQKVGGLGDFIGRKLGLPVTDVGKSDDQWLKKTKKRLPRMLGKEAYSGFGGFIRRISDWGPLVYNMMRIDPTTGELTAGELVTTLADKYSDLPLRSEVEMYRLKEGVTFATAQRRIVEEAAEYTDFFVKERSLKEKLGVGYDKSLNKRLNELNAKIFERDPEQNIFIGDQKALGYMSGVKYDKSLEKSLVNAANLGISRTDDQKALTNILGKITSETSYDVGKAMKEFARTSSFKFAEIPDIYKELIALTAISAGKEPETGIFAGREDIGVGGQKLKAGEFPIETIQQMVAILDNLVSSSETMDDSSKVTNASIKAMYLKIKE